MSQHTPAVPKEPCVREPDKRWDRGLEREVTHGYAARGRKAAVAPLATVTCEPPGQAGTPEARPRGATPSGGEGSQTTPTAHPGSARSWGRHSFPRSFFLTHPHHVSLGTVKGLHASANHRDRFSRAGASSVSPCRGPTLARWLQLPEHVAQSPLLPYALRTTHVCQSPTDLDLNSNPYQLPFIPRPLEHRPSYLAHALQGL